MQAVAKEDYRKQLLVAEWTALRADVLCLQEVSNSLFTSYLLPQLARHGYEGYFSNKISSQPVGNAVFVATERWRVVSHRTVDLTQAWRSLPGAETVAAAFPSFAAKSLCTSTSAQILELQEAAGEQRSLTLVNTHLFSHPLGMEIRDMQIAALLRDVEQSLTPGAAVVLCGDLNAEPDNGCITLLRNGSLGAKHADWVEGTAYGFVPSDTKSDREANWHAVLREEDFHLLRRAHMRDSAATLASLQTALANCLATSGVPLPHEPYAAVVQTAARLKVQDAAFYNAWFSTCVAELNVLDKVGPAFDVHSAGASVHPAGQDLPPPSFPALDLAHGLHLRDALQEASLLLGETSRPESFVAGRVPRGSVLDYVFCSAHRLRPASAPVPNISSSILRVHTGLPSPVFPSDHVAQVVDLAWIE